MCLAGQHTGVRADKLPGGPSRKEQTLVFTFEPIPERECKLRMQKKRAPRVLYPPHQVRKPVPPKKDAPKRLLLLFLSIVLLQVYTATEDETPDLKVAEQLGFAAAPLSSADDPALPPAFHAASPGAEGLRDLTNYLKLDTNFVTKFPIVDRSNLTSPEASDFVFYLMFRPLDFQKGQHGGRVVSSAAAQHQGPRFDST
eukprot:g33752.t1